MSQVVIRAVNHMNPTKTGATLYLAIHIIVSGVQYRDIRTFSVTEGWDSGGRIVYFGELDTYARTAIEKTWATLDGANSQSYDPVNSAFSLLRIRRLPGAGGWDNFILVFQCGRSKPVYRPIHEMTPLLLCYLTNPPGADRISLQHTITASHQAKIGDLPINYDWLDGPWRKAVKDQLLRANGYETDLLRHPWALKSMFRNHIAGGSNKEKTLEGLTLVLEWQECEPNALLSDVSQTASVPDAAGSTSNGENLAVLPPYSPSV